MCRASKLPIANDRMAMIDCCRGVAALFVVFHHAIITVAKEKYFDRDPLHGIFTFGGRGVDFFFVLSGFIITYVHWSDLGRKTQILSYVRKRFIRVYPVLWVVAIPVLLANVLVQSTHLPNAWCDKASLIVGSLSLVPTPQSPLPCGVWTLKHEALFYLMFILFIWRPRVGSAVFATWGGLCIYHATRGFNANFVTDFFLSPFNLEFLLGCCCGYFVRLKRVRFPVAISCFGAFGLSISCLFYEQICEQSPWLSSGTSGWQVLQFGLSSALLILGLSQLDLHNEIAPPKWLVLIGAASYSIYLIHDPAITLFCRALKTTTQYSGVTALQAFIAAGLFGPMVGVCFHLSVELPLLKVVRQALLPAKNKSLRLENPVVNAVSSDDIPNSAQSPVSGSAF